MIHGRNLDQSHVGFNIAAFIEPGTFMISQRNVIAHIPVMQFAAGGAHMIILIDYMFPFRISQNRLGHKRTGSSPDIDTVQFINPFGQSCVQVAGAHDELAIVDQVS